MTTQERSSWENCRSRPMDGSATLTIEASRTTTNCAAARRASAEPAPVCRCSQGSLLGRGVGEGRGSRVPVTLRAGYGTTVPVSRRLSSPHETGWRQCRSRARAAYPRERPLRADARRNRERILKAARTVFADQGADAQIDDVARKAKVGVGTVYRHFPTKDALLEALVRERFDDDPRHGRRGARTQDDAWAGVRRPRVALRRAQRAATAGSATPSPTTTRRPS